MEKHMSGSGRFITGLEFFVNCRLGLFPTKLLVAREKKPLVPSEGWAQNQSHYYHDLIVCKSIYISK